MSLETVPVDPLDQKRINIVRYARLMIWLAMIDFVLLFIFLFAGVIFLMFLIFFLMALSGWIAGRMVNRCWAIVYMISIIVLIIFRIVLMVVFFDIALLVLTLLFCAFDIYICTMIIRYIRMLTGVSQNECIQLRGHVHFCF